MSGWRIAEGPGRYVDQPNRSPWIAQMRPPGPARPLRAHSETDVIVVGAGIAGVATAFFLLRDTLHRVMLLERDHVGSGATGRNAGQLTTYFERPLCDIADEFGADLAAQAQAGFDSGHELLDLMIAEAGATVRVERFTGHMGMFNLSHVLVHLRSNHVRQRGGAPLEACVVSQDADFLDNLPQDYADLYTVVPQTQVRQLLETNDDTYRAVLSDRKGCANSGQLVQQVVEYLEHRYPNRFRYHDGTGVEVITVGADGVHASTASQGVSAGFGVSAKFLVLCTNGFVDHEVRNAVGSPIQLAKDQQISGRVAYMAAFAEPEPRTPAAMSYIRNTTIGGDTAYIYVTRRTYDRNNDAVTLTCMGGPEYPFADSVYDPEAVFPGPLLDLMDDQVRPFAQPRRPAGLPYDFQWHGLMGYNDGGIRVIGAHPEHPALLYNLGCNGVGFLPSVYGGHRITRILRGDSIGPSIFDPRRD